MLSIVNDLSIMDDGTTIISVSDRGTHRFRDGRRIFPRFSKSRTLLGAVCHDLVCGDHRVANTYRSRTRKRLLRCLSIKS